MNIFYYNEAFEVQDGSSSHAFGLLNSFKNNAQVSELITYPSIAKNQHQPVYTSNTPASSAGFSAIKQVLRYAKRSFRSHFLSKELHPKLSSQTSTALTVQLARVSLFDSTPIFLSKSLNMPLVAEWNTPFFYEIGVLRNGSMMPLCRRWEKSFLRSSKLIYTVSNQLNQLLIKQYNIPPDKLLAVPNGYDPDIYSQDNESYWRNRELVRLKNSWVGKTVIAFIGSLKVWHGIGSLIKIAEYFSERETQLHFVVIGDGECRKMMEDASQRLTNLQWMGAVPKSAMADYLTGCDLGIMPYEQIDHFYFSPLKLYDMIGAALPSIGLAAGQVTEIYQSYPETGWGIASSDTKDYIELIWHLLSNMSEISAKREQLLITRSNHTWNARANLLVEAFEKIIH